MFCSAGNLNFSGVPPDMFCADAIKGVARVAVPNIVITIVAARNIWFIAIRWSTRYLKDLFWSNDCYKYIMDLTTNGAIVTDAIKYVTQKTEQVNTLQKLDERIEDMEEKTTNGIF